MSSELPSSPLDGSLPPAGRTPAPQTAWSQTPELQLSEHMHIYIEVITHLNFKKFKKKLVVSYVVFLLTECQ